MKAQTFSDMARCVYMIGDVARMRTEGMELIKKAHLLDKNCAKAWLNKGNFCFAFGNTAGAK